MGPFTLSINVNAAMALGENFQCTRQVTQNWGCNQFWSDVFLIRVVSLASCSVDSNVQGKRALATPTFTSHAKNLNGNPVSTL